MKKVLIYSPSPLDGVSYYRQWGPMSALHDKVQCASFSNIPAEYTHWTWFLNYDLCLMSRPNRYNDFYFAQQCKKFGLPIWIDWDDALFHITPDNPVYMTFASKESQQYMTDCLKMADVITVCSQLQKDWFQENLGLKNVEIIPNALDDRLLKYAKPFNQNQNKKILWRGSDSHLHDLVQFREPITNVLNENPGKEFIFFGVYPPFAGELQHKNWLYARTVNLIDYYAEISKINPSILMVPLIDTFFNRVKSHLAWIDGTLAGAVCLTPDFEEWGKPGMLSYKCMDTQDYAYKINKLLGMPMERLAAMHRESFEWQTDNILLSKVNNLRIQIINNL